MAKWMADKGAAPKATLIDKDSKVGRLYDARTTPRLASATGLRTTPGKAGKPARAEAPPGQLALLDAKR